MIALQNQSVTVNRSIASSCKRSFSAYLFEIQNSQKHCNYRNRFDPYYSFCLKSMEGVQNLLLTSEEIDNSPSIREGMNAELEFQYRCFACELIRDGSVLLGLLLLAFVNYG